VKELEAEINRGADSAEKVRRWAHTRWATHGGVLPGRNAPTRNLSCKGEWAIVHNG